MVLASDLGIDARPFLTKSEQENEENWHDCPAYLPPFDEELSDLDSLQFFRLERGSDKSGSRIFRVVGKYLSAPVITAERLKKYVFHKILKEVPEGPFCIVYLQSTVQKGGQLSKNDCNDRLWVVYLVHPGLRSRLVLATLGRFFLSGGLY